MPTVKLATVRMPSCHIRTMHSEPCKLMPDIRDRNQVASRQVIDITPLFNLGTETA